MIKQKIISISEYKDAVQFAQELPHEASYRVKDLTDKAHERTIRRKIKKLTVIGLAQYSRGVFTIKKDVVSQPMDILEKLIPSLMALTKVRRFGKAYKQTDVNFMMKNLPENSLVTLDFAAYKMTGFQSALDLYVYVDDVEKTVQFLKTNNFREGKRGNVRILPKIGTFENIKERVFLDSIAHGGRSTLDAVAIQLKYQDEISIKARFTTEMFLKVQEDMPIEPIH